MTQAIDLSYRPQVYEIGHDFYAIPESFDAFDQHGEPVLEIEHGRAKIPEGFVELHYDWEVSERILAVRLLRDEWELKATGHNNYLTLGNKHFNVYTASQADDAAEKAIEDWIDENVPENIKPFVDEQKLKDHMLVDGNARFLATYDGIEHTQKVGDTTYYIYRVR